jgi:hypothetical protein
MPYTTEYAASTTGVYDSTYGNSQSRFACNTPITSSEDLKQSIETYKLLYNIYNTNNGTNIISPNAIFKSNCINQCPNDTIENTGNSNVFYASKNSITNKKLLVSDLDVYLDDCGAQIRNYNKNTNTKSYEDDLNYTRNFVDVSYNTLVRNRNDLDNKMNEILGNNRNSILYEKQNELDSSVYSTLLWTVMVTSLIYYVFVKL